MLQSLLDNLPAIDPYLFHGSFYLPISDGFNICLISHNKVLNIESHQLIHLLWKLGRKSALTPAQTSAHILSVQDLFLWLEKKKNIAALSELILQMVMHLHAGSHIKPWRVKMCMQIRAGRKGHKKNKCGQRQSVIFCFAFVTVFCFGQELIRGETEFSLKRKGNENYWIQKGSFWSLRDATKILFGSSSRANVSVAS